MLLPTATAEQECTGFHHPTYSALRETSGTIPGQLDQPRRPAVTPFLAANVAHPKRSGNLHRGNVKVSVETAAANPTLLCRKQSGFTVMHRAARCGGRGEDNPRAEETAAGSNPALVFPTSPRGTGKVLEETSYKAVDCLRVHQTVP